MSELFHECGLAAVYHLPNQGTSRLVASHGPRSASRLVPGMLVDMQNRGQLAAGMATYHPNRDKLLVKWKEVGAVSEVFRLNHRAKFESHHAASAGPAAIGHVRYATCGKEDRSYAQPFERRHIEKRKWFSFAFNGQLANYPQLRNEISRQPELPSGPARPIPKFCCISIARSLSGDKRPSLHPAAGATRPSGSTGPTTSFISMPAATCSWPAIRWESGRCVTPSEGPLFAAASESVALTHLGFRRLGDQEHAAGPRCRSSRTASSRSRNSPNRPGPAHCFFEWIYFANVASTFDDRSVYLTRKRLGEELRRPRNAHRSTRDTIVVPVPDTAKAAADAMAYRLGVPSLEGLIRNRYVGRTFIEGRTGPTKSA